MKQKTRNILILTICLTSLHLWLSGCGEDRWAGYATQTATDRWIDDSMRVWYYWADQMPATEKLNYFQAPATFFKSLLSSEDRFSTIDSLRPATRSIADTEYSYGMEYAVSKVNDTAYYALALYVVKESPADLAGIQRGDWIMELNGQPLTKDNYTALLGGGAAKVTVGSYQADQESITAYEDNPRQLPAACAVDDNPVYCVKAFEVEGKRVGYLAYNHFSMGRYDGNEYDESLRQASQMLAQAGISELVLDLRYNNGGYVSCAQLLCTLLAPASALGQPLAQLEFNQRVAKQPSILYLDPALTGNGSNLNLKRLYVLTGSGTASASEMVMNCLSPYMEVIQIGSTTVGKNMGARTFDNPEQLVTMSPLVCKIYNALGESDYEKGFSPAAALRIDETKDLAHFLPLGNPEETLLRAALALAAGSDEEETAAGTRNHPLNFHVVSLSLSRRATPVLIH